MRRRWRADERSAGSSQGDATISSLVSTRPATARTARDGLRVEWSADCPRRGTSSLPAHANLARFGDWRAAPERGQAALCWHFRSAGQWRNSAPDIDPSLSRQGAERSATSSRARRPVSCRLVCDDSARYPGILMPASRVTLSDFDTGLCDVKVSGLGARPISKGQLPA